MSRIVSTSVEAEEGRGEAEISLAEMTSALRARVKGRIAKETKGEGRYETSDDSCGDPNIVASYVPARAADFQVCRWAGGLPYTCAVGLKTDRTTRRASQPVVRHAQPALRFRPRHSMVVSGEE